MESKSEVCAVYSSGSPHPKCTSNTPAQSLRPRNRTVFPLVLPSFVSLSVDAMHVSLSYLGLPLSPHSVVLVRLSPVADKLEAANDLAHGEEADDFSNDDTDRVPLFAGHAADL
jgi:hypothetical protein